MDERGEEGGEGDEWRRRGKENKWECFSVGEWGKRENERNKESERGKLVTLPEQTKMIFESWKRVRVGGKK